jgi:hypothetical protein
MHSCVNKSRIEKFETLFEDLKAINPHSTDYTAMIDRSRASLACTFQAFLTYFPEFPDLYDGIVSRVKSIWDSTQASKSNDVEETQKLVETSYYLNDLFDNDYAACLVAKTEAAKTKSDQNALRGLLERAKQREQIRSLNNMAKLRKERVSPIKIPPEFLPDWYVKHCAKPGEIPTWLLDKIKNNC